MVRNRAKAAGTKSFVNDAKCSSKYTGEFLSWQDSVNHYFISASALIRWIHIGVFLSPSPYLKTEDRPLFARICGKNGLGNTQAPTGRKVPSGVCLSNPPFEGANLGYSRCLEPCGVQGSPSERRGVISPSVGCAITTYRLTSSMAITRQPDSIDDNPRAAI